MDILRAIILGIIQGLTEFLPVSSSGHLEISKCIFPSDMLAEESMLMTVVLHFATALSIIIIFRKDIAEIFVGLLQFKNNDSFLFSVKIILSMIPAVFVGLFFETEIKKDIYNKHKEENNISNNYLDLLSNKNEDLINKYSLLGFNLFGSEEIKAGFKDYSSISDILDLIQN